MVHTDPHAALLEHVANPAFYGAQLSSVRLLKQRAIAGRQVVAVAFTDREGRDLFCACELRQQDDGTWSVHGSAGGGLSGPRWEAPRANLGGSPGNQASGCYFGGLVQGDSAGEVTRVRLVSADGVILEDTVEEGVILFLGDRPVGLPLSADLYDRAGKLVTHHVAIRARTSPSDAN
jgi:hypothetical protein